MSHGSDAAARAGAGAPNIGIASATASTNAAASHNRRGKVIESMGRLPGSGSGSGGTRRAGGPRADVKGASRFGHGASGTVMSERTNSKASLQLDLFWEHKLMQAIVSILALRQAPYSLFRSASSERRIDMVMRRRLAPLQASGAAAKCRLSQVTSTVRIR